MTVNDALLPTGSGSTDLAAALIEVQNLLLDGSDVLDYLDTVAGIAAGLIGPGTSCGITMLRNQQVQTVAATSTLASRADELQYGRDEGPCLQAMRTGQIVAVPDVGRETRWDGYPAHAYASGVRSSLSLPMTAREDTIGAVNFYTDVLHDFTDAQIATARTFTSQATFALALLLRHGDQLTLTNQMADALMTRSVIDQAQGILMAQRHCAAAEAFALLREASQRTNKRMSSVAADIVTATSGRPPEPPRRFIPPRQKG